MRWIAAGRVTVNKGCLSPRPGRDGWGVVRAPGEACATRACVVGQRTCALGLSSSAGIVRYAVRRGLVRVLTAGWVPLQAIV
jgi:hypothetical protein